MQLDNECPISFLYADPTRGALQVLSRHTSAVGSPTNGPLAEGHEDGVWINADPIRGCFVVNIGESKLSVGVIELL